MSIQLNEAERQRIAAMGVQMGGAQHDYTTDEGRAYLDEVHSGPARFWNDPELKKITILRLLSDRGFPVWDVSYCHGITKDGKACRVILPFDQLTKGKVMTEIIAYAKADGVYAKGIGILGCISTLQ